MFRHTHTHTHRRTHTHTHRRTHAQIARYIYTYIHIYTYIYIDIYMDICSHPRLKLSHRLRSYFYFSGFLKFLSSFLLLSQGIKRTPSCYFIEAIQKDPNYFEPRPSSAEILQDSLQMNRDKRSFSTAQKMNNLFGTF